MEDAIFDNIARTELQAIEDGLANIDPDDVEVSVSDGVLRLDLRDKTRIVINAHRAAKQIWMAAVSTAWHFDPSADGRVYGLVRTEGIRYSAFRYQAVRPSACRLRRYGRCGARLERFPRGS